MVVAGLLGLPVLESPAADPTTSPYGGMPGLITTDAPTLQFGTEALEEGVTRRAGMRAGSSDDAKRSLNHQAFDGK